MDEIRPSSLSINSNCQQSLLSRIQKTLSTMITKNRADFIIAVMGNSIKCEKAGVRDLFLTKKLIEFDAVADWIKLHHL